MKLQQANSSLGTLITDAGPIGEGRPDMQDSNQCPGDSAAPQGLHVQTEKTIPPFVGEGSCRVPLLVQHEKTLFCSKAKHLKITKSPGQ